jgi:hypothetical protein
MSFGGDLSVGGPTGTWWFQQNMRHSNASNYWGTQIAWCWEDNANELYQRNVTGGSWSSWVRYINTNNYAGILDSRYYTESEVNSLLSAKQNASTAITTSNIGSQSVNYASSAGNADTVDSLHASDFVRAYTTSAGDIDADWGQSFKTFDPVPSGTPPLDSPNIRTVNIGEDFNRRTQLAFDYASDVAYFRRRDDSGWRTWREFIHSGNIGSQSVNYAATAGSAPANGGNSNTVGGLSVHSGRNNEANKIVRTDANGYIQAGWINTPSGAFNGAITKIYCSDDDYVRYQTGANFISNLGLISNANIGSQSVNYATSAGFIAWTNVGSRPTALSQFTNDLGNYGGWQSASTAITTSNIGSQSVNYAASAGAVAASGITGQTGMWTSTARPGAYRLYRNDDNSAYNVQTTWSVDVSGFWSLRGYLNDSYHAPCYVARAGHSDSATYSTNSGNADTIDGIGFRNTGSNDATNADNIESNGITYYSAGVSNFSGNATDGALYSQAYSSAWQHQIAGDYRSGQIALRGKNNGTWRAWRTVLDSENYATWAIARGGDTVTGVINFLTNNGGRSGATDSAKLQAYSTGNNAAFMSFHKAGQFAINFGLDDDNVMRMGGWSASANLFQMDMSGNLTMKGDVIAFSDERVKENIQTLEGALDKVLKLRGVSYNRKDTDDKSVKIGVIAQEILKVVPEVVSQDANGTYGVAYGNIVGLLIEALKEQQAQINELKKRVND